MPDMLRYFDGYVKFGLKPIAMYLHTKIPIGKGWTDNWSIDRWRHYFDSKETRYNMGLLLGNVIDVEADSDESNKLLNSLLGNVPHPIYTSVRSVHHLFLTPDPKLTKITPLGIEFRSNGHCSALPPSMHKSGVKYQFLKSSELVLNPLPDDLLNFYWEHKQQKNNITSKSHKAVIKPGHKRTICNVCGKKTFIHEKRLILEVKAFAQYYLPWMCQACREIDIRNDCRKIRKNLRNGQYC